MMKQVLLAFVLVFCLANCGCRRESGPSVGQEPPVAEQESSGGPAAASSQDRSSGVASPPDERPAENQVGLTTADDGSEDQVGLTTADDASGVRTVNTGDSDVWPSYDFPLVIRVEVPELPETITEPSPPVPGREDG